MIMISNYKLIINRLLLLYSSYIGDNPRLSINYKVLGKMLQMTEIRMFRVTTKVTTLNSFREAAA